MSRINLLDKDTFNKIAAGEVVERPFSVVKELVENSIDAGSKNITIEIIDGGQKLIKISDDGYGIHPDDIEKALLAHATSKINKIEDVFLLSTMGFRGEALASICSVSKTKLKSRYKDFDSGKEIYLEGGHKQYLKDVGMNVGTVIEVEDLFYNVPARLKFLKSASRETALISDIVHRLALAHPDICFKLINNNKTIVNTYGTGNIKDVIRTIYGKTTLDNLIDFECHLDVISVHGFVGNSEISRKSRNNQSVFVNKRYIKSKLITTAVENAFKSFLTVNKFPFFILFIDIFPEYVDVNVHPTKTEIKFNDDRKIFSSVFNTVHEAIKNSLFKSFNEELENDVQKDNLKLFNDEMQKEVKKIQLPIDLERINVSMPSEQPFIKETYDKPKTESLLKEKSPDNYIVNNSKMNYNIISTDKSVEKQLIIENIKQDNYPKFKDVNIIGQFNKTYILAEVENELYIIDQHAAHEKILFEKYMEDIKNHSVRSQILITPTVIELLPDDFNYYIENQDIFSKSGFKIDVFGDNTINIKEVPFIMGKPDINNLFMDIIDNIKSMGSGETSEVKYNKIATLACKSAVKAHDKLSTDEMQALIKDLRYAKDPFTCPHGRPTIIKFTLKDLEKKFKRIQ